MVDISLSYEEADVDISKLLMTLCDVLFLFCDTKFEGVVLKYILQVLFSNLGRVCDVKFSSSKHVNGSLEKARNNDSEAAAPC